MLLTVTVLCLTGTGCDLGVYDATGDGGVGGGEPPNRDSDAGTAPLPGCNVCHGNETSSAPPKALNGDTATTSSGVGAHRSHLNTPSTWRSEILCTDCHIVPQAVGDPGHMDDGDNKAELTFGARARLRGSNPSFDGQKCNNVYCHGDGLGGGVLTSPKWTLADGTQAACGNCHGAPPPAPHVQSSDCGACHPTMQPGTMTFLDPDSHINGVVDVSSGSQACDSCHGSDGNSAPPKDLAGNTAVTNKGVGAHRAHLGPSAQYHEVTCSQCHTVPTAVDSAGHLDGDNKAEVKFGGINAGATYSSANATCSNNYCHGNGWQRGSETWNVAKTMDCRSCHDDGNSRSMSGDHRKHIREGVRCYECHEDVVDRNKNIIGAAKHVDGANDVKIRLGGTYNASNGRCSNMACHGSENW